MTEIIAIVRRHRAEATKAELGRLGAQGYSVFPVLGRGRQRGLRVAAADEGLAFLPKVLFDLVTDDEQADEVIEAIMRANQTGHFGDGRIFVMPIGEAYRISTDEREAIATATEVTAS